MLPHHSIKSLYPLALAEGEGVGTAYEYYAKRRALARWLKTRKRPQSILIAGLPEKYGSSLDFFQIAEDLSVTRVVVVDDRPAALEKLRVSLGAAQRSGALTDVHPECFLVTDLAGLKELSGIFDLCLGSEVLQRLDNSNRPRHVERLCKVAAAVGLFAPNVGNASHATLSGLSGLDLDELQTLAKSCGSLVQEGYVDMPPFPPGLTRSAEQRTKAAAGRSEAIAMAGLGYFARFEPYFPSSWRRSHAHIVYGFIES